MADDKRARFGAWWWGDHGPYSLRAEWPGNMTEAAWMAWEAQEEEIAKLRDVDNSWRTMMKETIELRSAVEAENAKLRTALAEIISFQVFGFAITAPEGGDVWCEGTNRFVREEAMVKVRKIARAALGCDT